MAHTPFDALPAEVVEEIAFRACTDPFLGPPAALPALLCLSRRVNAILTVVHNPGFHARIFRAKFDTAAPHRRFLSTNNPLTAVCYALELRRRWTALRRIRHISTVGRLSVCSEEEERADFWMLYLMFIESDGKNYEQLIHWAQVTGYVVCSCCRLALTPSQLCARLHPRAAHAQSPPRLPTRVHRALPRALAHMVLDRRPCVHSLGYLCMH